MLMLVSFAVLLMFQMLGSYRIARERFGVQAERIDRAMLFDAWFSDSVRGLHPVERTPFAGAALAFSGVTLNPLFAPPGAPAAMRWELQFSPSADAWQVRYFEDGTPRWALPLAGGGAPRFVYLDADGAEHGSWPPALGVQVGLPAAVALVRGDASRDRVRVASVLGPYEPRVDPFMLEDD